MSKNGLNFVTKDEENKLTQKDQKPEIKNIFRLLYIIHNKPYEGIEDTLIISNFLTNLMINEFKEEGLSKILIHYLPYNNYLEPLMLRYFTDFKGISIDQYLKMRDILKANPSLLIAKDLMKINRCMSYMSFVLKDIFEYADAKGPDGTNLTVVRNAKEELNKSKLDLESIDKILKSQNII